ncbi:hypothetical protein [Epilithonimonas arachidiradicis]|uniref:Uncharacterized protein n=1 Tax=Epilithonimonas arachidiradicis TaxID=1617282 RepID=A0A420DCE0_9FLAO|nr:hypothetical protein [Epilithonimonas arachidiradicis]RKE89512.1 hypothetical protein BXY58_0075 [Epilithonimonas arachidiradicis]GGG42997.1 hypothetical protein GCM10007332_00680 [Epilithonimonas arachidiradicis]
MKLKISIIFSAIVLLFSCRGDEDDIQVIDQVLKLYVKDAAGQDLLNSKIPGSYSSVALLDQLDETTANKPISGQTFLKDADTVVYMDYAAGAIRQLKDSISPELKTYRSRFIIRYSKTVNSQTVNDDDIIEIEYKWTPSLFQLSKLWYDNELKFTKTQAGPNIVTIVK